MRLELFPEEPSAEVAVKMGSLAVSDSPQAVLTTFVGSCVALCIYDPISKVGGLAHIMLPDSGGRAIIEEGREAKYADRALKAMLNTMKSRGAVLDRLVSKMVGGAKMFSNENSFDDRFNVGDRNCDAIRSLLKSFGIPLIAESIGSSHGKWVTFDLLTGTLVVRSSVGETVL